AHPDGVVAGALVSVARARAAPRRPTGHDVPGLARDPPQRPGAPVAPHSPRRGGEGARPPSPVMLAARSVRRRPSTYPIGVMMPAIRRRFFLDRPGRLA